MAVTNVNNTFERIASLLVQGEQINEQNLSAFGIGELNNNSERLLILLAAVIQNLPAKVIPNVSTFSELPEGYRGLAIVADDPATADNSNVYLIDDGLQVPLINADKCTDANIRNLPERLVKAQKTFWMTDAGMEGFWRYNPSLNDSNCADNVGIYRKTVWGGYLERVISSNQVSVTWFGAKGDGSTNDSFAIQKAVDTRKNVFFPQPKVYYLLEDTVTIYSYQNLTGESYLSQNSTDNVTVLSKAPYLFVTNNGIGIGAGVGIKFSKLSFSGFDKTNKFIKNAIQRLNVQNCTFKYFDIVIENTAYSNSDVVENLYSKNFFINNKKVLSSNFPTSKRVTDANFIDNFIVQNEFGLDIDKGHGWNISTNHFYGSIMDSAIRISGFAVTINDNYLEPSLNIGIDYTYSESSGFAKTKISNNIILQSSINSSGIKLWSSSVNAENIDVYNNVIDSMSGSITATGIRIEGDFSILGTLKLNTISSNISTDISVQSGLTMPRQISLRQQESNGGALKLAGINGIVFNNNTRLLESFGKPTFSGLAFGSMANVYNQSSGSILDIGLWGFVSGGWKQYVNFSRRITESSAMPNTGTFVAGDICLNNNPSIISSSGYTYTLLGWRRISSSSNNVIGTDWVEMRVIHSFPV